MGADKAKRFPHYESVEGLVPKGIYNQCLGKQGYSDNPFYYAQFYLPTLDNWAPNFERDTVRVAVLALFTREASADTSRLGKPTLRFPTRIRVVVGGADDTMIEWDSEMIEERDFDIRKQEIVKFVRNFPNPITREWLLNNMGRIGMKSQ
jgi:hypothetical protein